VVFVYHDGTRWRKADALAAFNLLLDDPEFDLAVHPRLIAVGDRRAWRIAARTARWVFGVPPFEKGGLHEQACVDLLGNFIDRCIELKKKPHKWLHKKNATNCGR
jgi:hypothetical protein